MDLHCKESLKLETLLRKLLVSWLGSKEAGCFCVAYVEGPWSHSSKTSSYLGFGD